MNTEQNANDMQRIELEMSEAKKMVERKDKFLRLQQNQDFKDIIETGYFEEEPSRLVLLMAEPSMQDEENQKNINNSIIGIGELFQYFRAIVMTGNQAEAAIRDNEQFLDDMENDGGNQ